jgi:hypothetical protein
MTIPKSLSRGLLAACFGLALAVSPVVAHAAPVAPSVPSVGAPSTETTATAEGHTAPSTRSYAEREAAAPQTADFKGQGAGIYIGGSTAAVVLLIVLVVVLL